MDFNVNFNCGGKVNVNDWQLNKMSPMLRGEVDDVLYPGKEYVLSSTDVKLFDSVLPAATAILSLDHLTKCMEMNLHLLNRYERCNHNLSFNDASDIDFFSIRHTICEFIVYIRTYMNSIRWDQYTLKFLNPAIDDDFDTFFLTIRKFLGRLGNISDSIFHYAPSNLGNKCAQPEFHLYHIHLELRWFFITLIYMRYTCLRYIEEGEVYDSKSIHNIVFNDLIYISLKVFERIPLVDLCQKTPYSCTCVRELWLMLQLFIDDVAKRLKLKPFWDHVNLCIDTILSNDKCQSNVVYWHKPMEYSSSNCKNPELFCIWIIHHLSLLYGYNKDGVYLGSNSSRIQPNYEQVEKILKAYICKGGKDGERDNIDEELKIMIPLLQVLMSNWWPSRTTVVSLLWDCFHKRLNQPFLLKTSGPWAISVEKKTPMDILKHIKNRIENDSEQIKDSSYGMFLRLLGTFLKKKYDCNDTKYWNQIKGRIYSKFSKSKVQEFSETGIYNFLSLFLTLAITADTINVCTVMCDLLPSVQEFHNGKKCNLIWKGKLVILLLLNEHELHFNSIASYFTEMVNTISCCKDESSCSMMASYVDVLDIIFSNTRMELGEHLLIGGWVDRYLLECPKNRINNIIGILNKIFDKCLSLKLSNANSVGVMKMLDALWSHVACRVRQLVFNPKIVGDHYRDLSKLAAFFTLEALNDPVTAKRYKHSAISLFQHFTASIAVKDIRITRYYLMLLLQNEKNIVDLKKEIKNLDLILIQAWIKCSILGHDENKEEIEILQNYISEIDEIKQIFITSENLEKFKSSSDSVLVFIMSSMQKKKVLKTEEERSQFDTKYRLYFNNLEKWILSSVNENSQEQYTFWIYRCIGTLILCCSPILYIKNNRNNMLKILIHKVALPSDHSSQSYVKNSAKRIFLMIILGLENLNFKDDISLQALIRDLFDCYIPLLITEENNSGHFKVSDTLLQCFRDAKADFIYFIFEMLMVNFFTVSDSVVHKHSYFVILLLKALLKGGRIYAACITEFIVEICTPHILGCYMKVHEHHPHKQHTIDFFSCIFTSCYYEENTIIREKLDNIISNIIQKYLTIQPQFTFELMRSIATQKVDIIKKRFFQVENIVKDLEKHRRINAPSLRYSWGLFQNFVQNIENKR